MRDKYIIALDEFPLKLEKSSSMDYGGFIVYRIMGSSLLNINNSNCLSGINIQFCENVLIIHDVTDQGKIVKSLKDNLDQIYNNWSGKYRLLLLGINIKNNKLYTEMDNEISISFRDKRRMHVFLYVLQSHFCNYYKVTETLCSIKKSIVVQSDRIDKIIEFVKIKNRIMNLLLYHLKMIDVTANNVIGPYTYALYRKCKNLIVTKSGIECTIVCTNKESPFFYDAEKRKYVFSKINSNRILSLLSINLTPSELNINYDQSSNKRKDIVEISITYDDYYPNKIIVNELKRQLKENGIKVKLIKGDFKSPKEVSDFRLYLFSDPFHESVFSYYFLGMKSCLYLSAEDYRLFLESYLKYCQCPSCNISEKEKMRDILSKNYIYFSVGELNSTFLSRYKGLDFVYEK